MSYPEKVRKLATPVAEVQQWLDLRRLATEINPDLSSHERNIDLNQLDRAKEEVKTGISGKGLSI